MKRTLIIILTLCLMLSHALQAQEAAAPSGKLSVGVLEVKITPSLQEAVGAAGADKLSSLRRVAEAIESQTVDRLQSTRKFDVIARRDLSEVLKDQDLQRVLSDPDDPSVPAQLKVAGCKYVVVTTVDDYQDLAHELLGDNGQVLATKRKVRLSAVSKLYDTSTAKILETANFLLTEKDGKQLLGGTNADGREDDHLMIALSHQLADRVANRVVDVVYPAKLMTVRDGTVTLNRGDGTGIAEGQVWTIYALGEELVDPDTGESLGREEVAVGKVQITKVNPKVSQGKIIEDGGVDKQQVARLELPPIASDAGPVNP